MREFTTPREAMRDHQCLSRAVVRCGEQFEQFERARLSAVGALAAEKRFVSQCAAEAPNGGTFL